MSGFIELFRGKCSIYALDETSKDWAERGVSGQLVILQNNQYPSHIGIKWIKNPKEIWWRLHNGQLKPKGERAWVLKAWDTVHNKQEILAIRFSHVSSSQAFSKTFHQLFLSISQQQQLAKQSIHKPPVQHQQQPPNQYNEPNYAPKGQYMKNMSSMHMNNMMIINHANNNQLMAMNNNQYYKNMQTHNNQYNRSNNNGYNNMNNSNNNINNINNNMNNINNNNNNINNNNTECAVSMNTSWECAVCTYSNDINKESCIMCGLSQNSLSQQSLSQNSLSHDSLNGGYLNQHSPPYGSYNNSSFNFQQNALNAMQQQSESQKNILSQFEENEKNIYDIASSPDSWVCSVCTLSNSTKRTRCDACNGSRTVNKPKPKQIATIQEFKQSASDIACYNDNLSQSQVFRTLRSVAKKLLKDDIRYRTLDTTNPRVMEKLIGFEGVLDFLMLLGFESDAMGTKLICEQKPTQQVVRNAVSVLNNYENLLDLGRHQKKRKNHDHDDDEPLSYATLGGDEDFNNKDEEKEDSLTLQQIIIWSTHENTFDNDDTMETLILTHKQFTNSLTLLRNLRRRFNVLIPNHIKNDVNKVNEFRLNVQKRIQLKVMKSLRNWMKQFWDLDFLNNLQLQKELNLWLKEIENLKSNDSPWISSLSSMVNEEYERYKLQSPNQQKKLQQIKYVIKPQNGIPSFLCAVQIKKGYKISNTTSEDLADQISLMNYRTFHEIEERECIGQCWKKRKEESPNILLMIQEFNNLVSFVQIQILSEKSLKDRSKAIKRIIKMGERFKYLNNYNSLCAIMSALNSTPIHRLQIAWKRLSEKQLNKFQSFKQIFINTRNFRNYRTEFRNISPPAIPYFGLFLQDLVSIDEGNDQFKKNPNLKQQGFMVNFSKSVRTMDRIKNIRLYQTNKYENIKQNDCLQKILYSEFFKIKDLTQDEIWNLSTKVKKADEGK